MTIDETDRMLEKGHFQELQQLLEKINISKSKVKERQTFVFSATLTMVHDIPTYLKQKKKRHVKSKIHKLTPGQKLQQIIDLVGIKNPKIVDITKESGCIFLYQIFRRIINVLISKILKRFLFRYCQ